MVFLDTQEMASTHCSKQAEVCSHMPTAPLRPALSTQPPGVENSYLLAAAQAMSLNEDVGEEEKSLGFGKEGAAQ